MGSTEYFKWKNQSLPDEVLIRLKKLTELYHNGNIEEKLRIIGSIFPEKWTIIENKGRTGKVNLEKLLIYQVNYSWGIKKPELELKLELSPAGYPAPESNRHSFLSVFETDASTSSASWAFVVDICFTSGSQIY